LQDIRMKKWLEDMIALVEQEWLEELCVHDKNKKDKNLKGIAIKINMDIEDTELMIITKTCFLNYKLYYFYKRV
jgi:hypothetical protein